MLLQLALKAFEQGEGVCGGAGKTGNHLLLVEPAHLAGIALHHRIAEGDLTVAADHDPALTPYGQDGCASELFH